MKIDELKNFANTIKGKLNFNYDLKKSNWFKRFAGIQSRICQETPAEG